MGANFCFASVPYVRWDDELEQEFLNLIASLNVEDINQPVVTNLYQGEPILSHTRDKLHEDFIDWLWSHAEELFSADDSREVDFFYQDKSSYVSLITGGMTWGDSPTDAYNTFHAICSVNKLWSWLLDHAVSPEKL
jgi:hypothetical protein